MSDFLNRRLILPSPLWDGLVALWELDEATGTRYDRVGNNHLTANGSPGNAAGPYGDARGASLNGTTQYFSIAHNAALAVGNVARTWAARVYFTSSTDHTIMDKYSGGNGWVWSMAAFWSNKISFDVYSSSVARGTVQSAAAPALNTWHVVFAWLDPGAARIGIQVNAEKPVTGAVSAAPADSGAALGIGARASTPGLYHAGRIQGAAVWGRVLSAEERRIYREMFNPM